MSIEFKDSGFTPSAYYRFEAGALTTDSSGNSHTGTAIANPVENSSGKFGGAVNLNSYIPIPKAYYRFNSGALTTDSSGNSRTLTAISDPADDASGKFGNAAALDGNDGFYGPNSDTIVGSNPNAWTAIAWFKTSSTTTQQLIFTDYYDAGDAKYAFFIGLNQTTGYLNTSCRSDGNTYEFVGSTNYADGNWHMVACTFNKSTLKMNTYVDGSNVDSDRTIGDYDYFESVPVSIGTFYYGAYTSFLTGSVDDVALFDSALSSTQISALYNYEINNYFVSAYSATDHADFKPTGNFTVGGWINISAYPSADHAVFFQSYSQNSNSAGFFIEIRQTTGILRFLSGKNTGVVNGTDFKYIDSDSAIGTGWRFITATWDGSYLRLYVDGASATTAVAWANAPAYAATNYVRIGCMNLSGTNSEFLTGSLDDVFLINGTALSAAQILDIYQNYILTAEAGSFTLTGQDTILTKALHITAETGSFILTGISATFSRAYTLVAEAGSFVLTGIDATFSRAYTLIAETGSFVLTGFSAILKLGVSRMKGPTFMKVGSIIRPKLSIRKFIPTTIINKIIKPKTIIK